MNIYARVASWFSGKNKNVYLTAKSPNTNTILIEHGDQNYIKGREKYYKKFGFEVSVR